MSGIRRIKFGGDEFKVWLKLRLFVLREPLGLGFSEEEIAAEADDFHLCRFVENPEGTLYPHAGYRVPSGECLVAGLILCRLSDAPIYKMRQVAVLPECQNRGLGVELVQFSERFVRENGGSSIVLHARETAVRFYEKLDYQRVGESFEEVGIVHFKMQKDLNPA